MADLDRPVAPRSAESLGRESPPAAVDRSRSQRGLASWYGRKFHGRRTASGERYDMYALTAAHPTLPLPSYAKVRNPANGSEVLLRINDRGPFHPNRIIDLSYTAAQKLGVLHNVAMVEVERITPEEFRAGLSRRDPPTVEATSAGRLAITVAAAAPVSLADGPSEGMSLNATSARPEAAPLAVVFTSGRSTAPDAAVATPMSTEAPLNAMAPAAQKLPAAAGYWVQLGAFRLRDGAETFQRRVAANLDWIAPLLSVVGEWEWYRLRAGPYASREEADGIALRVREALSLAPMVVESR